MEGMRREGGGEEERRERRGRWRKGGREGGEGGREGGVTTRCVLSMREREARGAQGI